MTTTQDRRQFLPLTALALLAAFAASTAHAQTFRVQCPNSTADHPLVNGGPNPGIKCQQISGGDGFATMADGTQTYLFAFGPLSGLADIAKGLPGTQPASVFNEPSPADDTVAPGPDHVPGSLVGVPLNTGSPGNPQVDAGWTFNGAIGQVPDPANSNAIDGHVDARFIMDVGVLNGNMPAPLMAIDEDDEFFLTLTNVGQVMRPDLFEQHTVHFHGYPNASAFYDGVPDASAAVNIGGSFTYYYLAPDAGTYIWHCHITPPEHLEMGMVGQVYVRPRQNKVTGSLYSALQAQNAASSLRTKCDANDILCTTYLPAGGAAANTATGGGMYAYNDGDGSTRYDVEYPIQLHGFDPNFHFVGMTFNPENFTGLKDKYFLMNGRSYPDTVHVGALATQSSDGTERFSQPLSSVVNIPNGGRALIRLSDLNIGEYHTLASLGIPMHVVGYNAKLLRDQEGVSMAYDTNSVTLAGGESVDIILDACQVRATNGSCTTPLAASTFYLYTPQLDHLSNDAENFGGMMTEVNICSGGVDADKQCL